MSISETLSGGVRLGELVIFSASNKGKSILMEPLPRQYRIDLAVMVHGLYTIGMAVTDGERCDEDCAMDNMGIPYYWAQLTERDRVALVRVRPGQVEL